MLTKKAKYALNALVYLAKRQEEHAGVPITAAQIAKDNKMPSKFLEGILSDLKRVSILRSIHGKGGGYLLQKEPHEIPMVEVIRMFDGAVGLIPCATHQFFQPCAECRDVETCKIRWTFKELRDITVDFMKDKTIADLI